MTKTVKIKVVNGSLKERIDAYEDTYKKTGYHSYADFAVSRRPEGMLSGSREADILAAWALRLAGFADADTALHMTGVKSENRTYNYVVALELAIATAIKKGNTG